VAEGQHLHRSTTQPQSVTEADDQVHEIGPFQMPPIKRNELRAVYARILAAGNKYPNRDDSDVQAIFNSFYASNLTYHMTYRWIVEPGAFTYNFRWVSQTGTHAELKGFTDRHFEMIYGVHPDAVRLL